VEVVESVAACRAVLDRARAAGRVVGLVPTMGALHAGHTSLLARARAECDVVAVSIFVNPLQFGDPEDIAHYPRTLEGDLAVCTESGADLVFVPTVPEMYPSWPDAPSTTVSVRGVSEKWEGASRPGHFDGVATVVAKLFTIAGPCRAYFGLKDFQQLAVVRRMARELSLPVEVVGCPIVREADGLALSSRNVRLSPAEREAATVLARALEAGRAALAGGERSGAAVAAAMRAMVATEPLVALDYAVVVDADTLGEVATVADPGPKVSAGRGSLRLLIAAQVGPVRLIDNSGPIATADEVSAVPGAAGTPRQLERIG
jgi:pantoate--beta-alanine ligase